MRLAMLDRFFDLPIGLFCIGCFTAELGAGEVKGLCHTLVSLLLVGTNLAIFKIHNLAGINFSDFIISSFNLNLLAVSSEDEPSQKADV